MISLIDSQQGSLYLQLKTPLTILAGLAPISVLLISRMLSTVIAQETKLQLGLPYIVYRMTAKLMFFSPLSRGLDIIRSFI